MSFASEGQTTYNLEPSEASPGQIADLEDYSIASYPAAEVISPGRLLQMASDNVSVKQVQNTSSDTTTPCTKVVGVSVLKTARAPSESSLSSDPQLYQIGDMVPVMKRGKIFVEWKSSAGAPVGTNSGLNVYHSSTTSTDRGKFTADAAASTSGSEVSPVPNNLVLRAPARTTSGNIQLLEINLPGGSA